MSQLRRIKNLAQAALRSPSPQADPDAPVTPVVLGKAAAAPPGLTRFDAPTRKVAVARVDGAYYAFSDICTHLRCSLSEGDLDGTTVTCICHGSQFDVTTGDVLHGPAERPVEVYTVRVQGDDLVADLPS
jgi:nitrite reductase/ring-hydroxylating ferredoxin subunit